jgi:predicted PurR-regulated permease PerM
MPFPDRRTANMLLTILFFGILLVLVYRARRILLIFAFAVLFAYLIDPIVRFLQRHSLFFKDLRKPAVVEAYLAFLLLMVFIAHAFAPGVLGQSRDLIWKLPGLVDGLSSGEIATQIGGRYAWSDDQELHVKLFLLQHRENVQFLVREAVQFVSTAIWALTVVPVLAIFFLRDGAQLANSFIQLVSTERNHETFRYVANDINIMLRRYIRAKVILGGLSLGVYWAAMLVLGFPHAFGLGVLGGVLEFVPVAGWIISAGTILAVGVLSHSHWMPMAALLILWRIIMDYWIAPRIVGHNLEVHPLTLIFLVMVGAEIGGIVGIYIAVPTMIIMRVIWRRCIAPGLPAEGIQKPLGAYKNGR